jgi:hypothetical protein
MRNPYEIIAGIYLKVSPEDLGVEGRKVLK